MSDDAQSILKDVLTPLLGDFHYWFDRCVQLLANERVEHLSPDAQSELLEAVQTAQAELAGAEALYKLADERVGIDPQLVGKWHRLLMVCASVGEQHRRSRNSA